MISSPSYNPNKLSFGKDRNETFLNLFTDTLNKPFMDRSLQAKYPPGSIFKPILALAALQEGITYPERGMTCLGQYSVSKGFTQGCRKHPRPTDLQTALQFSCNSYFFQIVREFLDQFGFTNPSAGLNLLNKYLKAFGLGSRLGVDLLNENSGFLPTPEFYNNLYNTPEYTWRSTYVLSLGIGQGEIELTTIQMANLAAILANKGFYYVPHIIKGSVDNGILRQKTFEKRTVPVDAKHFPPVIEGMFRVVEAGTGRRAYVSGLDICGKTGTSQNPHGNDHSVFFGFAPKDNPKIAIAVFVENAGGGSTLAAPIGGFMIEKYLRGSISESRLPEETRILDINLLEIP
jgi:penicillin-binding protein 2